jgi:hypothetical protein
MKPPVPLILRISSGTLAVVGIALLVTGKTIIGAALLAAAIADFILSFVMAKR